jgi:hypothetical protein
MIEIDLHCNFASQQVELSMLLLALQKLLQLLQRLAAPRRAQDLHSNFLSCNLCVALQTLLCELNELFNKYERAAASQRAQTQSGREGKKSKKETRKPWLVDVVIFALPPLPV